MIITSIPLSFILAKNDAIKYTHNKFTISKLLEISQSYTLDIHSDQLIKLTKGWEFSHQLINTPNNAIRTWLLLDKEFISPFLKSCKYNQKTNILEYTLHDVTIKKDLTGVNLDYEFLSYYYREGYKVVENHGSGYYVSDPYGSKYYIDLITCNCINYLSKGKCLHLTLAKTYHHNLRKIRDVENTFIY